MHRIVAQRVWYCCGTNLQQREGCRGPSSESQRHTFNSKLLHQGLQAEDKSDIKRTAAMGAIVVHAILIVMLLPRTIVIITGQLNDRTKPKRRTLTEHPLLALGKRDTMVTTVPWPPPRTRGGVLVWCKTPNGHQTLLAPARVLI